jgi:hypothetical protein
VSAARVVVEIPLVAMRYSVTVVSGAMGGYGHSEGGAGDYTASC